MGIMATPPPPPIGGWPISEEVYQHPNAPLMFMLHSKSQSYKNIISTYNLKSRTSLTRIWGRFKGTVGVRTKKSRYLGWQILIFDDSTHGRYQAAHFKLKYSAQIPTKQFNSNW